MNPPSETPTSQTSPTGPPAVFVAGTKKSGPSKKFLLFATFAVLILGIIAAVYLVQNRQLFQTGACDCALYNFHVDVNGNVTVSNGQTISEPAQKATVTINGSPLATLDVPALSAGETTNIGIVQVPTTGEFTWSVIGSSSCSDSGSYTQALPTPIPISGVPEQIKICHYTSDSKHPWQAIEISLVDWPSHISHGDFLWDGPEDIWVDSGYGGNSEADLWCEDNVPSTSPTATPIPTSSPSTPVPTATVAPSTTPTPTSIVSPTSNIICTPGEWQCCNESQGHQQCDTTGTIWGTCTTCTEGCDTKDGSCLIALAPTATPKPPSPTLTPTPIPAIANAAPGVPNVCNGTCGSDANCGYAEDGTKLICVSGLCRHPNCADQISCHCPAPWPTSTTSTIASTNPTTTSGSSAGAAASQLPQSGNFTPTLTISVIGIILLGLGLLLVL